MQPDGDRENWAALLAPLGITVTEAALVRDWEASRVVRLRGPEGVWYAKLVKEAGDRERWLYRLASSLPRFPAPPARFLAVDGEEWLLLSEAPGRLLAEAHGYLAAARGLARFHARSVTEGWTESLAVLGRLVESLPSLAGGGADALDAQSRRQWPDVVARFARYPVSLLHGDSHYGNLFLQDDGEVCLIDWSSATLGPGLLDLVGLWDVSDRMKTPVPPAAAIRTAYLEALPAEQRAGYGDPEAAWAVCRAVRAVTELAWFAASGGDYRERAARERAILHESLGVL